MHQLNWTPVVTQTCELWTRVFHVGVHTEGRNSAPKYVWRMNTALVWCWYYVIIPSLISWSRIKSFVQISWRRRLHSIAVIWRRQTAGQWTHQLRHPVQRARARAFNGPLSRTTRVSQYQKGKTNLDFIVARAVSGGGVSMGHMPVCTSLQTDNHASTLPLGFLDRMLLQMQTHEVSTAVIPKSG